MTVITISRQLGARGEEIASQVAQALELRLIDAETINRAAQKAGVPEVALAELEHEGKRGLANQVLTALRTMPGLPAAYAPGGETDEETAGEQEPSTAPGQRTMPGAITHQGYARVSGLAIPFTGLFTPTVPPISASLEEYVRMVGLVIRGLAQEGNVLIVGRGGQMLLQRHPWALHVQIVAPFARRVSRIMDRENLDKRAAQHRIRASDRARFDYVRRYHDANWLDASLYHLVINTARLPVAVASALIIDIQRTLAHPMDAGNADD
jgi:cytidylate kinase